MSNFKVVGGGWIAKSKNEKEFIRIQFLEDVKAGEGLTMWKNNRKHDKNRLPDFVIMAIREGSFIKNT